MDNLAFVEVNFCNDQKMHQNTNTEKIYTFDEAVTLTGNGKFHMILLMICGTCFMAVMIEIMGISMIMEPAKCDLNFTIYEQGLLASAGFLGVVLSSHAMGFFADTCGRIKILKYALLLSSISSVISIFSITVWMLIILRFLVGFFISGCQACVFSYIGEFHGSKTRIRYITLLSAFLPLGLIFLPAMALIILPLNVNYYIGILKFSSWRLLIFVNALPSIVALICLQFLPESPKYLLIQNQHDAALEVLKTCYAINFKSNRHDYPVKRIYLEITGANFRNVKGITDALHLIWSQTVPLFDRKRILYTLDFCLINFLIFTIAQGTFMWFPSILNGMVTNMNQGYTVCHIVNKIQYQSFNLSSIITTTNTTSKSDENICDGKINTIMFQFLMGMGAVYTTIYLIFSYIIDRVGKKKLLIIWMIISGCCTILLYWANNFYINLILLTMCMAIGNAGGIVNTISVEYFPTNINAMGMCLMLMIARLGAVAGSNIVGIILSYKCEMLFLVFGTIIIGLIPLSYLLPNNHQPTTTKL